MALRVTLFSNNLRNSLHNNKLLKLEEITATYNSPKAEIDANITLCEHQQDPTQSTLQLQSSIIDQLYIMKQKAANKYTNMPHV